MPRYDIVLFDADDTLFDFPKAEEQALRLCLESSGYPYSGDVYNTYHNMNHNFWEMLERKEVTLKEIQDTRFQKLFSLLGYKGSANGINSVFIEMLGKGNFLLDGAEELCRTLSDQYSIYIVTNGIGPAQYGRIRSSALAPYISGIFVSDEIGAQKPYPEYFESVFRTIKVTDTNRVIMVGDRLTADISGANAVGIDSIWCNFRGEANVTGILPTYEVKSLCEISEILLPRRV